VAFFIGAASHACGEQLDTEEAPVAHKASFQTPDALNAHDALLTRATVLQVLGIGVTRLYELIKADALPGPVQKVGSVRWLASDIRAVVQTVKDGGGTLEQLQAVTTNLLAARGAMSAAAA
jgi:predicted DNA-binding transcriptional regulator AlpA